MSRDTAAPEPGTTSYRPFARQLLDLAESSIDHGLARGAPLEVDPSDHPAELGAYRASFVTLHKGDALRGCIGSMEARRPLVRDIAENAYAAAFRDPRFPALTAGEREELSAKIEILSPPEPLVFTTEEDLLAQLEPGRDGVLLEAGQARGTFLPTVWASLPEVETFWCHLKRKAGLPADYFSTAMAVYRYRTEVLP